MKKVADNRTGIWIFGKTLKDLEFRKQKLHAEKNK